MEINQILHGFKVTRIRTIKELEAEFVEMTHLYSHARLCWSKRAEQNKTFSISFRTLPTDDTGVFHILEHSVLGGSEKYPVREPFAELLKTSVNTFLNAMTFPDKTMYPVASRNNQDFINLIEVYLDAVFHPTALKDERVFLQEGWHYELDDSGKASYQGIVFNEMKGDMSDADEIASQRLSELLYPDSPYRFNSGGDPASIPCLTHQQFCEAHAKYYHPSSAYLYLDGDVELDRILTILDRELSFTPPREEMEEIPLQQPVGGHTSACYELGEDENPENKDRLCTAKLFATWKDQEKIAAAQLICKTICSTNETPFKKAILQRGLAQNVIMSVDADTLQATFGIDYINTSREKFDEIRRVSREIFEDILQKGLNKEDLLAQLNATQFQLMNHDEPIGLSLAESSLRSMLYGGDPMQTIAFFDTIQSLRQKISTDYFERLLREMVEGEWCEVELYPSKTLGDELRAQEEEKLAEISSHWDEAERESIREKAKQLKEWQSRPDTPEALATLPVLTLDDLRQEPCYLDTIEEKIGNFTLLRHPSSKHGIVHLCLYFQIPDAEITDYCKIKLFTTLLTKLPTRKHDALTLQRLIKMHIGLLTFSMDYTDTPNGCLPQIKIMLSVLAEELDYALSLVKEILYETEFDHPDKVMPILLQNLDISRQTLVEYGLLAARILAEAHFFPSAYCEECGSGFMLDCFEKQLSDHMDTEYPPYVEWIHEHLPRYLCLERLTCSLTSADEISLPNFTKLFVSGSKPSKNYFTALSTKSTRQGIAIPVQVSSMALVTDLRTFCPRRIGSMQVLSHILSYEYLWNEIRVKGGAYGTGFYVQHSGSAVAYSFRDATPLNSLSVMQSCGEFIRDFVKNNVSLDRLIIGALSDFDPPVALRVQISIADKEYFFGITHEEKLRLRKEALNTDANVLISLADLYERCLRENSAFCVLSSEKTLSSIENLSIEHLPS